MSDQYNPNDLPEYAQEAIRRIVDKHLEKVHDLRRVEADTPESRRAFYRLWMEAMTGYVPDEYPDQEGKSE